MAEIPVPMTSAPAASRGKLVCRVLAIESANPELKIATSKELSVIAMSYVRGMGRENASMPMKCMAQMPVPMAREPPDSHSHEREPGARATRADRRSAVWETTMATRTERTTRLEL